MSRDGPRGKMANQWPSNPVSAADPTGETGPVTSAKEVVERMYAAFRARDLERFSSLCAPDIEWIQSEGFPGGGRRVGPHAIFDQVFTANGDRWEGFGFEIERFLEAESSVVVIGAYVGSNRETGERFRAAAAHLYDVADGRITRYRQYADTHVLWAHTSEV